MADPAPLVPMSYRKGLLASVIPALETMPLALAAWEGGSASHGALDEFSDLDLCVLAEEPAADIFSTIEAVLACRQITHSWTIAKPAWPGLLQKLYFLGDAPRYFFVDVAVFPLRDDALLRDFLEVERHGHPIVYFDRSGRVTPHHVDGSHLAFRHEQRRKELRDAFPVYKTLVLKELERNNAVDALSFYQSGLVRALVEIYGMTYRPFQFDFGLRYLSRHFPPAIRQQIEGFCYVSSPEDLARKVDDIEKAFFAAVSSLAQIAP